MECWATKVADVHVKSVAIIQRQRNFGRLHTVPTAFESTLEAKSAHGLNPVVCRVFVQRRGYIYGAVKGHREAAVESLDGTKPNTNPKTNIKTNTNPNTTLTVILILTLTLILFPNPIR